MNDYTPRSRVVLAEMNEPVIEQPMDETRDDVAVLDTPQDSTHEMTSTQVPRRSGRNVRPPIRFISLGETYKAIPEEAESDPYTYEEAMNDIDEHHWVQKQYLVFLVEKEESRDIDVFLGLFWCFEERKKKM